MPPNEPVAWYEILGIFIIAMAARVVLKGARGYLYSGRWRWW